MPMRHILLIDDDPSVTRLLRVQLNAQATLRISEANTSQQALALARERLPDLIVCDIDMGEDEMDGGDLAYELRKLDTTAHIPVIFLSSMITPQDMGERSGRSLMVSKMSGIEKVVQAILAELG